MSKNNNIQTITKKPETARYAVHIDSIEWDIGKDNGAEYDPDVVAQLPKTAIVLVLAPNEECAKDWAMEDMSNNWGFLIQGCNISQIKEM